MRLRRETREKIRLLSAAEVEMARNAEARTITASDFAFWTSTTDWQVRKEIDDGTLPVRMIGKRRRILITPAVRLRLEAGMKKLSAELCLDDHDDSSADKSRHPEESVRYNDTVDPSLAIDNSTSR
jgi:hypothetical protein